MHHKPGGMQLGSGPELALMPDTGLHSCFCVTECVHLSVWHATKNVWQSLQSSSQSTASDTDG